MFWMDADTVTFESIPQSFLEGLLPPDTYTCFLGRPHFTETGFVWPQPAPRAERGLPLPLSGVLRPGSPVRRGGVARLLDRRHRRREFEARGLIKTRDLSPPNLSGDHAFINSEAGNYMDHLKGKKRKKLGRSWDQLEVAKDHSYWTDA